MPLGGVRSPALRPPTEGGPAKAGSALLSSTFTVHWLSLSIPVNLPLLNATVSSVHCGASIS